MREARELGRGRRADRKEGWLRDLKATEDKKSNQNMERVCEGDRWITSCPAPSMALTYPERNKDMPCGGSLIYPYRTPPLTCDICSDPFTVNQVCCFKRGGDFRSLRQYNEQGVGGDVRSDVHPSFSS